VRGTDETGQGMTLEITPEQRLEWKVPAFDTRFWLGRNHQWCVAIPVINEGPRIGSLLAKMATLRIDQIADIIIVDGGSTDGSLPVQQLKDLGVLGLLVMTGPGKLSAQLRCVYSFALDHGFDGIVTIDGNDKDDPEAIIRFIDALSGGVDFAQASRFVPGGVGENTPRARDLAIRWIHAPMLSLFSGFHWTDTTQGFRAYSRRMLLDYRIAPFRDVSGRTNCWPTSLIGSRGLDIDAASCLHPDDIQKGWFRPRSVGLAGSFFCCGRCFWPAWVGTTPRGSAVADRPARPGRGNRWNSDRRQQPLAEDGNPPTQPDSQSQGARLLLRSDV